MSDTTYQRGIYNVYLYEKEVDNKIVLSGKPVSGVQAKLISHVKIATFNDGTFALVDATTLEVKAEFTLDEWMLIPDSNFNRQNDSHIKGKKAVTYVDNLKLPLVRNG